MRELHVVALSEDGRHVILATSPQASTGGFRVAVDDRLRAALRGDLGRPGDPGWRPESTLSPREIQARLRAGETAEAVARAAGVPVARIDRFSGPVLSERARVVDDVRAAVLARPRRGLSVEPLGVAVDTHLAQTSGLRTESVSWTASRREDGTWAVELGYVARARAKTAAWSWNPLTREVAALDPIAASLAHIDARSREPDAAPPSPAKERRSVAGRKAGAARTGARGAAAKSRKAGGGARKAAGRTAPARTAAARAASKPAVHDQAEQTDAAAGAPASTPATPTPGTGNGATGRGRVSVPNWADILLGTAAPEPAPPATRPRRRAKR